LKRFASRFILLVILVLTLILASVTVNSQLPTGADIIRIRSDGTVEGTDKIQRNGDVYTLTGNIDSFVGAEEAFIFVEKDNIVVDGAGYTIQGLGQGTAIHMMRRQSVTIKNFNIKGFEIGINFWAVNNWPPDSKYWGLPPASNNRILNNNIWVRSWGINLRDAVGNLISGNTLSSQDPRGGIYFCWTSGNTSLFNNKFVGCGLYSMSSNQTTALGNTVDGKPLVYLDGASNKVIDDAGLIYLFNCKNMTIKNIQLSVDYGNTIQLSGTKNTEVTNCEGYITLKNSNNNILHNNYPKTIELSGSNYNKIFANTMTDTGVCIKLYGTSNYNNIYWNSIVNRNVGIECHDSSNNNIYANNITDCSSGISLGGSDQNSIFQNNIINCSSGIFIHGASSNNDFYHNNFIDNRRPASESHMTLFSPIINAYSANNTWDAGYPSGGNYWSDYNGTDADGDGIGDTPYSVYENYTDHYPLMNPVVIPEFPDTTPHTSEPFPTTWIAATIGIAAIVVVGATIMIYFVKIRKTTGEGEKMKPEGVK